MARRVKIIDATDSVWYVPNVGDNRSDPDPFAVRISSLSGEEYQRLETAVGVGKVGRSGRVNFNAAAQKIVRRIFEDHVLEVTGYEAEHPKTGAVSAPKTGADLFEAIQHGPESEGEVIDDIVRAIRDQSHMSEGEKKALNGSAGGSEAAPNL